jgi:hypothetical protein
VGYSTQFLDPDAILRAHDTRYTVWGPTLKTLRFHVLWPFRGLFHTLLGSRAFSRAHDTRYTVRGATLKTHRFHVLWPFRGLFHTVLWTRRYFESPWHLIHGLRGNTKNSSFPHFMAISWAIPHCFGSRAIFRAHETRYMVWGATLKTHCFCVLWPFRGLFHTVLGSRCYLESPWETVHGLRGNTKKSLFSRFMAISWANTLFWDPDAIWRAHATRYTVWG